MAIGFVRDARPGDAGEIARIQLGTWRHAYRRFLPHHILDGLDIEWVTHRWRISINTPPTPRHRVLVAVEQAGESYLVGFIASGDVDDAGLVPGEDHTRFGDDVAAVTDLVVEPRWSRRGHGSRLLAAATDRWREDGYRTALAWAFQADTVFVEFLRSAGWQPDGAARALEMDELLVPQIRLHTSLSG